MHTRRLLLLFSLVWIGAYAEHQAGETMKQIRANEKKLMQYKNETKENHIGFIKQAIDLSYIALMDNHGHPFGSVVVREAKIMGQGWNKTKLLNDPSAHAEVEAIRDACKNLSSTSLKGCVIYASSQPCPMCMSLIYLTGIEKIYYCIPADTINSLNTELSVEHIYRELAKPPFERSVPEIPILQDEVDNTISSYKAHYR